MTLTQLGALLGIDSGALSKIENGKKSLDAKNLPNLAKAFSLDIHELNKQFMSEKIACEIINNSCDETLLALVAEKIRQLKSKNIKQSELKF